MRNKRGQVTIFIIIAIVIISIVGLYFVFDDKLEKIFFSETTSIKTFVEDCIERTGEDAIYHISKNGGYYLPTKLSTSNGIAYYYYNEENYMPSGEKIENEISLYLDETLEYCTGDFSDFPEFNVSSGKVNSKVTIEEGRMILDVEYPLSITKGKSTSIIKDFRNIKVPVRLKTIYMSIEEIMQDQLNREDICLSCITDVAIENGLTIDIIGLEEATIFIIKDESSEINGVPLEWRFANNY